jgi:hypothetical protein
MPKKVDHAFNNARFYRDKAEAFEARIAEAPRAWVALYGNRIMSLAEATAEGELAIRGVCCKSPFTPHLVALVKLNPEEVG